MLLSFSKYQGAGNDFILIDDRSLRFPADDSSLIQKLCSLRFGIGADGIVLLRSSTLADFRMRIYNLDGTEASFCGNGLRCLALYIEHLGLKGNAFSVETESFVVPCTVFRDKVSIKLPFPKTLCWGGKFEGDLAPYEFFVVDSGVPHAVIFVEDLETYPVQELGKAIRFHSVWAPSGVNVNFIKVMPDGAVRIRTYERGVEGETLSCGSGAAAAAFVVSQQKGSFKPLRVTPKSGEHFEFSFQQTSLGRHLLMQGPASLVFEGKMEI